jgi:hypothetical protein
MAQAQGIRAGAAYIELSTSDSKLVRGLRSASRRLSAFGGAVRQMGMQVIAIGRAIWAPLIDGMGVFSQLGDEVHKMALRTGFSTEALSELGFAAEQSGQDLTVVEAGIRGMQRTIRGAQRGLFTATDALKQLGLSFELLQDLSPEEQFKLLADRLSQVEDRSIRTGLALEVLGRSGMALLPLMEDGAAGMEALQKQARDLGLTISGKDADAAALYTDQMNVLRRVLMQTKFIIGSAVAPAFVQLSFKLADVLKSVAAWLKEHKFLMVFLDRFGLVLVAGGAALVMFGILASSLGAILGLLSGVISGVGTAIGILGSALAALMSPIGLVIAGVVSLAAYLLTSTDVGAKAVDWLGERFKALWDTAVVAFRGIGDALAAGDLALAAKILWLTLKLEWQKGVNALQGYWLTFKEKFLTIATEAFYGAAILLNEAWSGLQVAWVETTTFLSNTWTQFTSWLVEGWNSAVGFLQKAWARFKSWFDDSVDFEAEAARVDQEIEQRNTQVQREAQQTLGEREAQRQRRRGQIEQEREGTNVELVRAADEEHRRRREQQEADVKASEAALEKARREWQEAIEEAARKRRAAEAGETPDRIKGLRDRLLGAQVEVDQKRIAVQGTFNAAGIRGLQAAGPADRLVKATEATAVNTKELVKEITRKGGLVFQQ